MKLANFNINTDNININQPLELNFMASTLIQQARNIHNTTNFLDNEFKIEI